jgi:hypothetical protein
MTSKRLVGLLALVTVSTPLVSAPAGAQRDAGPPTVEAARQVTAETDPARLFVKIGRASCRERVYVIV